MGSKHTDPPLLSFAVWTQILMQSNQEQKEIENDFGDAQPVIMRLNSNRGKGLCIRTFMDVCMHKCQTCLVCLFVWSLIQIF